MKYVKISAKINTKDKPPYFLGSQLRGALGYALKNTDLELFENFYKDNNRRDFRFDYFLGQNDYSFNLFLFGKSCKSTYLIVSSLLDLLKNIGLGKERIKYEDFEIFINEKSVYKDKKLTYIDNFTKKFKTNSYSNKIKIELITPFSAKKHSNLIRKDSDFELEDLLASIYKRKKLLKNENVYRLNYIPSYTYRVKNLYFKDLTRFSNRKNIYMKLGGLMGEVVVENLDRKSYKLLKLGEILGAGKECSFGLGKITIKEIYG